jgi:hypothetical protein
MNNVSASRSIPAAIGKAAGAAKLSEEALIALVGELTGAYPNPEDSTPPGPWDPLIRAALQRMACLFGPGNEPWAPMTGPSDSQHLPSSSSLRLVAARHPEVWDLLRTGPLARAGLHAQPLLAGKSFVAAIAEEVIERASFMHEIANLLGPHSGERRAVAVDNYVSRFVDEFCARGKIRWPYSMPPPSWFQRELSAADLLTIGTRLRRAAAESFHSDLGRALDAASAQLIERAIEKLQPEQL